MSATIEEKYSIVRERDERFAFELAKMVIEKPRASIWIIFLPALFIFHAYWINRYKKGIHDFSRHYLQSKRRALDKSLEECKSCKSPQTGSASAPEVHIKQPADPIRKHTLKEQEILRAHYRVLLHSPGRTYPSLVKNAYRTSGQYRYFLNRLLRAEEEINKAVIQAHHPAAEAQEVVQRMERYSDILRETELKQIFS
ncbi:MAG: NF038143 family protein [Desulfovibrionales bacterium]